MATGLMMIGLTAGCSVPESSAPPTLPALIPETTTTTLAPEPSTTVTIPETTTTTSIAVLSGVFNPDCVQVVILGDTLTKIANAASTKLGQTVTVASLVAENALANADEIDVGQQIDFCVDPAGGINDITGEPRLVPDTTTTTPETTTTIVADILPPETSTPDVPPVPLPTGVDAQQTKLNELFVGLGMPPLDVDKRSGPKTEQMLCAARVALGLPVSRADMVPGSAEEQLLMSTTVLPLPVADAVGASHWGVIDQRCQVMFLGENSDRIVYVFPVSTGMDEFPTRNDTLPAHRYDPAIENAGWHNSADFPAAIDNPLNGNMYEPVYINLKQAIHGALNVPLEPASHGCTRNIVANQDKMIDWLDIRDIQSQRFDLAKRVEFVVTTQGAYAEG